VKRVVERCGLGGGGVLCLDKRNSGRFSNRRGEKKGGGKSRLAVRLNLDSLRV